MTDVKKKIRLHGYVDVPPDRLADVTDALVHHIRLTRAEAGCISFEVIPCTDVVGRFLVAEEFESRAAFDNHQSRTGRSDWAQITAGLPRKYKITEV
jgi:quinol monooxygenase YgiN